MTEAINRHSPDDITRAASAIERIKSIDRTLLELVEQRKCDRKSRDLGEHTRRHIGQNLFPYFTDASLGLLVRAALVAGLARHRAELASDIDGIVIVPALPPEVAEALK